MKYVKQLMIILIVSLFSEFLEYIIPLSVPASVYGLVLMVFLLCTHIVKLEMVEDVADFMLSIMPFFFVAPTVSLMTSFDILKGRVLVLVVMCILSSVVVIAVTGSLAQLVIRLRRRNKEDKHE